MDVVNNGQDALDYGLAENYDALVLDIMMPKLDGASGSDRSAGAGALRLPFSC